MFHSNSDLFCTDSGMFHSECDVFHSICVSVCWIACGSMKVTDLCGVIGDSCNGGSACVWCLCGEIGRWCPCTNGYAVVVVCSGMLRLLLVWLLLLLRELQLLLTLSELSNTAALASSHVGIIIFVFVFGVCPAMHLLLSLLVALMVGVLTIALAAGSAQSEEREVLLLSLSGMIAGSAQCEEVSVSSLGCVLSGAAAGSIHVSVSSLENVLSNTAARASSHVGRCGAGHICFSAFKVSRGALPALMWLLRNC